MNLDFGTIEAATDWELEVEISLLEPSRSLDMPMRVAGGADAPRANLVLSRKRLPEDASPESFREAFLKVLAEGTSKLEIQEQGDFEFQDGSGGCSVRVLFEGPAELSVAQLHVFRADGPILTHFAATIEAQRQERLASDLARLIQSYTPKDAAPE